MPYRKRKTRKRKAYRRYKQISTGFAAGMPKVRRAKLRYCETITIPFQSIGTFQSYVFAAGNAYDPNLSGIGHQPMGWDQWTQYYNHYVVTGSKITAKCYTTKAQSTSRPTVVGLYLADDTTIPFSDITPVVEAKKGTVRVMNANQVSSTISSYYSAKKFFNITDIKDNYTRLGAPVTTGPTEQAYFVFYHAPLVLGEESQEFTVMFTLEYVIEFSEPKDIPQS